jgi:hypothetical protein
MVSVSCTAIDDSSFRGRPIAVTMTSRAIQGRDCDSFAAIGSENERVQLNAFFPVFVG